MWSNIAALPGSVLEMQRLEPLHSLALLTSPSSFAIQCFLEPVSPFKNLMKIKCVSPENNTHRLTIMIQPRGGGGVVGPFTVSMHPRTVDKIRNPVSLLVPLPLLDNVGPHRSVTSPCLHSGCHRCPPRLPLTP